VTAGAAQDTYSVSVEYVLNGSTLVSCRTCLSPRQARANTPGWRSWLT